MTHTIEAVEYLDESLDRNIRLRLALELTEATFLLEIRTNISHSTVP